MEGKQHPKFISGVHEAQGRRETMEDTHVLFDIVKETIADLSGNPEDSVAFYGVFDGHGGVSDLIFREEFISLLHRHNYFLFAYFCFFVRLRHLFCKYFSFNFFGSLLGLLAKM